MMEHQYHGKIKLLFFYQQKQLKQELI